MKKQKERDEKLRKKEEKKNKSKGKTSSSEITGPVNITHVTHVGWSGDEGFQVTKQNGNLASCITTTTKKKVEKSSSRMEKVFPSRRYKEIRS